MNEYYFHCTQRDMLVAKDLSDCTPCPLRSLTINGQSVTCEQYLEAARNKMLTKLGLDTPPEDIVLDGLR